MTDRSLPAGASAHPVLRRMSALLACAIGMLGHLDTQASADAITADHATRIVQNYKGVWTAPPTNTAWGRTGDTPLLGNGDVAVSIAGKIDGITFQIGKNEFWSLAERRVKAMARLKLSVPALALATYRMEQDISTGQVTGTFTRGTQTLNTTSWVAANDTSNNMLVTKLVYTGATSLSISINYAPGVENTFPTSTGAFGEVLYFDARGDSTDQVEGYDTRRVRVATRIVGGLGIVSGDTLNFTLQPGGTYYLVTSIVSLEDNPSFQSVAIDNARGMTPTNVATLEDQHKTWWRDFYARSYVEIPDKRIEKIWYGSLYLLASTSRPGEAAPGLWGGWVARNAAFNGDYTLNYNYETPFYMALPTNHLELAMPYDKPILDWLPKAQAHAAARRWSGAYYRVHIGPLPNGSADTLDWNQKSMGAWASTNMIMRYYYTRDAAYATSGVYDFLKQVALFWQNYLYFDGTRYVILNDAQHEGNPNPQTNGVVSLGLVRLLLQATIDISSDLNVDAGLRTTWQNILDKLSAFPTQVRNGETVFRYTEVGKDWHDGNAIGIQHIYPGGQIGLSSDPTLLQIARNMVRQMARWIDTNGTVTFYPAAARVGHDPKEILFRLRDLVAWAALPNLHISTSGGGLENLNTVPATLSEMFIQSYQDAIRVFPNWPVDQSAKFGDLMAYGGFLVSSDIRNGEVQYVRFVSNKGRSLKFFNPWPGRSLSFYRNGILTGTLNGEQLSLASSPGEVIHMAPVGTSYATILNRMSLAGPVDNSIMQNVVVTADSHCSSLQPPSNVADGSWRTKWCSTKNLGAQWLKLDFGSAKTFGRWIVRHAGSGGEPADQNTKDFKLQKSADGLVWTDVDAVTGNTAAVTDRTVTPFSARFLRVFISVPTQTYVPNPTTNVYARIYEVEVY